MQMRKMVLVIEDLKTKEGKEIAVVSGDVHYFKSAKDKVGYCSLINQIEDEKDEGKIADLMMQTKEFVSIASFQMALDMNKDFQRHIAVLGRQAVDLKEAEDKKKNTKKK